MCNDLVSIVIPTKNRPEYVVEAVQSVCQQTYPLLEIIVVDDGSDMDMSYLKEIDERISVLSQESKGVSAARNLGIQQARGSYVSFLDDDDRFFPEKLSADMEFFQNHPNTVWLCSSFSFIDDAGVPLPRPPQKAKHQTITLHNIAMFNYISTSSITVKKDVLEACGGFPDGVGISEDYHLWAKMLMRGEGAALSDVLSCVRLHGGNTAPNHMKLLRENRTIIDFIMTASSDQTLQSRQTYIENLHRIISDNLWYKKRYVQYAYFSLWRKMQRWFG